MLYHCCTNAPACAQPDFDDDDDDAARNGKGMGDTAGKGEEGDDEDYFNVDEVIEYQVKVTVEELGSHGSAVSSEETGSKVVATTVHAWYPTQGEGTGKWTEESHDGAGSLRGERHWPTARSLGAWSTSYRFMSCFFMQPICTWYHTLAIPYTGYYCTIHRCYFTLHIELQWLC